MFMLSHNKNSKLEISFTVVITVIAILTLSMVKFSAAPVADHSYDAVERMHVARSFNYAPKPASYDQIENARAQRALSLTADSYKTVEQLRTARGLSADRSYDNVENARALHNNFFSAAASVYDQIEALRTQRNVNSAAVNSSYDLLEQLRAGRGLNADRSYDLIETQRLQP